MKQTLKNILLAHKSIKKMSWISNTQSCINAVETKRLKDIPKEAERLSYEATLMLS